MSNATDNTILFDSISNNIVDKGYSISPYALPKNLTQLLLHHIAKLPKQSYKRAGIGRAKEHVISDTIRADEIAWITNNSEASCAWLAWISALKDFLNRRLFLGLFSFESHFSHYRKGDFYKVHKDAFKGEGNRVLSVVVYLNQYWSEVDGGELLIYQSQIVKELAIDNCIATVTPNLGTIVVFLSEEFPHEVLAANRDRYAIAGWFRLNNNMANTLDLLN